MRRRRRARSVGGWRERHDGGPGHAEPWDGADGRDRARDDGRDRGAERADHPRGPRPPWACAPESGAGRDDSAPDPQLDAGWPPWARRRRRWRDLQELRRHGPLSLHLHDELHRGDRGGHGRGERRRALARLRARGPWVWWIHVHLRQKIFLWLGVALAIGAMVGKLTGPLSRGWTMAAVLAVVWLASSAIAWRLTRPLSMVVEAARRIGEGDLEQRIRVRGRGELAILATALNEMSAKVAAQLGEQRQLLAAVSHELRTPLAHLRVLLETARERGLPPTLVDELDREVLGLDELISKLLASSRLEFGHVQRRSAALGPLVAEAALAAGVEPELIAVEGRCEAEIDAALVRRAVGNLLDNAKRHGGGVTAVAVRERDDAVEIEVEDAGPGVPAERRADAFSAFVPSAAGGLGLGLALVQRIARAHGGTAWLGERPGGGTRAGLSVARGAAASQPPSA